MRRGPLTVQSVRYNRNGVMGDGFYVVAFTVTAYNTPLLAVLFPDEDGPLTAGRDMHGTPIVTANVTRCAIVDPAAPTMMHKYDHWVEWLAEAIDKWAADGRAFRDAA